MKGEQLSHYDREVLKAAEANHIWLNAMCCVKPTDEFKIGLADSILAMLNCKENLIYRDQDNPDETLQKLGKLTPILILKINKS
jgi:hypothetical protein